MESAKFPFNKLGMCFQKNPEVILVKKYEVLDAKYLCRFLLYLDVDDFKQVADHGIAPHQNLKVWHRKAIK